MNSLFIILSLVRDFPLPPPRVLHPRVRHPRSEIPPEAIRSPIIRRAISARDAGGVLIHLISVIAGSRTPLSCDRQKIISEALHPLVAPRFSLHR